MAQALIEFYNQTSGAPMISSQANTLVMKSKGTHSSLTYRADNSTGGNRSRADIPCSPNSIIVWRPRDARPWSTYSSYYDYSNSKRVFFFMSELRTEQLIDWWVFDKAEATNTSDVKFEVYDEQTGALRWQLYTKPMKIVTSLALGSGSVNAPAGKTYAAVMVPYVERADVLSNLRPGGQQVPIGVDEEYYQTEYTHGVLIANGSTVSYGFQVMDRATNSHEAPPLEPMVFGIAGMLVVDVTGL
jgi:hypothetical protein